MMLNILDEKCQEDERLITQKLLSCVDCKRNLIFHAGAGAGKTYALIECLKYVCTEKAEILKYHNQKAICITYTNVAANEIKMRLGNTDLVLISTIHEWLWDIIKEYQEELLMIHLDNLKSQIDKLQQEIETNAVYSTLTEAQKEEISILLVERQKEFYGIYDSNAREFRERFYSIFPTFNSKIDNVTEFAKTCSKIIRVKKYEQCILLIKKEEKGYTEIKYDARNNKDYLHYMKISHDTLLMYADQIICKYDELKRFIVDKYPYFFIDEYQDTSERVVNILNKIAKYSNKITHPIFVGYFGDSAQNIYDTGIGEKIDEYCTDYEHIKKQYNRRSCSEIILLSNRIRNDQLEQRSVYKDSFGGSIKVYYGAEEDIEDFIYVNSQDMKAISVEDKSVHCFLLVNKIVAKHSGLANLYDWFYATPFYKQNYDILATELLSNDVNKLGEIERYLYNLTEFFLLSHREDTPLLDILSKELLVSLDIESIVKIVDALKKMTATSIKDIFLAVEMFKNSICKELSKKKDRLLINKAIDFMTGIENFSLLNFVEIVAQVLFQNDENAVEQIESLLNLNKEVFFKWYRYVNRNYDEDVVYHTFHSTKGLEYDNVIIVFGDAFGQSNSYFNNYFTGYNRELNDSELEAYRKARNLLYVAVSRARINLRILYTGDYLNKKERFDTIFDNVSMWKKNT